VAESDDEKRLEASLQSSWDPDTAAVYADLLTSRGNPRGELIAIELAIERGGWTRELDERRREKLFAWLGGDTLCDRRLHPRHFRHGLVDFHVYADAKHSEITVLQALLASPAGNYVHGLGLSGGHSELSHCLNAIAAHGLPWLRRLAISRQGSRPIANDRLAKVFDATPQLDELILEGPKLITSPGHPNVRTLRIAGGDSLVIGASPMTWVTTLDLAFEDPDTWRPVAQEEHLRLAPLVNPRTFPALHTLDLSRNDLRRYSQGPHPGESVFPFLDAVENVERIAKVRLPAIHTDEGAVRVLELLARFPDLEVEIARMYVERPDLDELAHPRLRVPQARVWPMPGLVHGRDALSVDVPGVTYGDDLALSSIVRDLENQFEGMPLHAQAAWIAVWEFLGELEWEAADGAEIVLPFDAQTLLVALEALDGNRRCDDVAAMIRNAKLADGTMASIKRYWGW
jgi:hypothetical protein